MKAALGDGDAAANTARRIVDECMAKSLNTKLWAIACRYHNRLGAIQACLNFINTEKFP